MSNYFVDAWERHMDAAGAPPVEIPVGVADVALVDEMRRNPYAFYCRRRNCGHLARHHEGEICLVPGCECEGLKS